MFAFVALTFIYTLDRLPLFDNNGSLLANLKALYVRPLSINYPANNPYSREKARLGKRLFFDPLLSRSGTQACATCHSPALGWSDGLPLAVGNQGVLLDRKSPTILNAAFGWSFFWDGRAQSLEEQALQPIQNPREMNLSIPELIVRLKKSAEYRHLFSGAFPDREINQKNIARALATFERQINSKISPFDRWIEGNESALSIGAKRGFILFNNKAQCAQCHSGWNFTNGMFSETGVPGKDVGRQSVEPNSLLAFAFKTPTLRNIGKRKPYMHNGIFSDLMSVINHYDTGGTITRAHTRNFIKPLHLNSKEKADLLAFLLSLNEEKP